MESEYIAKVAENTLIGLVNLLSRFIPPYQLPARVFVMASEKYVQKCANSMGSLIESLWLPGDDVG
jgi:hypothetical protein